MTREKALWFVPIVLLAAFSIFWFKMATHFPPYNPDEIIYSAHGRHLLTGAGHRYALYDDIFASSIYALRDASWDATKVLYNGWVGAWILRDHSGAAARHSSWGAALGALLIFFAIGKQLEGSRLGIVLMSLLLMQPVFWLSASIVRPEILLLFAGGCVVWLACIRQNWTQWVIGALCGLAFVEIHQNALALFVGISGFVLLTERRERWEVAIRLGLGFIIGTVGGLLPVDLRKPLNSQTFYFKDMYRPPIGTFPWHPLAWIQETFSAFLHGPTYYFNSRVIPGWQTLLAAYALAVVIAAIGIAVSLKTPNENPGRRRLLLVFGAGLAMTFLAFAALVKRKEILYEVMLFPFLIPALGLYLTEAGGWRSFPRFLPRLGVVSILVVSQVLFFRFAKQYARTFMPFDQSVTAVKQAIGDDQAKVVGPNILWFAWDEKLFRDAGALVYSHWLTGGKRDLREWLAPWQPSILIVDDGFKRSFVGKRPTAPVLADYFACPVDSLGVVDTGPGAHGIWEIYRIRWKTR